MSELAELLPLTHSTFLGRFAQATPVQTAGIPAVLQGRHVLLCAPTASGKTEAYAAPLMERLLAGPRGQLSCLIVSPTRALANDLKRRLEGPLLDLGISFGRYTGEYKELSDGRLPEVALATPEAFDSLLARRSRALQSVWAVVLDEIHVLDGTPRGDQARVLLHRLECVARQRPQRIAASATVEGAEGLAARYAEAAIIVRDDTPKPLFATPFEGRGKEAMSAHLDRLAAHGFRKILVFCNARNDVEELAYGLRGRTVFNEAVFAHHGSLARSERERTERRFQDAGAAVAVATMTLELGIDIGTVDFVLLAGPPPDVAALLQRVGRGNRRADRLRFGWAYADAVEAFLFGVLLDAAGAGRLLTRPYAFKPGVLLQQALVLAGERGSVTAADVHAVLPQVLQHDATPPRLRAMLDAAAEQGLFEPARSGSFVMSETQEKRWRRGSVHANLDGDDAIEVVDRLTGEALGSLDAGRAVDSGDFALGGKSRRVVKHEDARLVVDVAAGDIEGPSRFKPRPRAPVGLDFGRAVARAAGLEDDEIALIAHGPATILLHGLGTIGGLLLNDALNALRGRGTSSVPTPFTLRLSGPLESLPALADELVAPFVRRHEKRLAVVLGMGPHHRRLPGEWRLAAVLAAADLTRVAAFVGRARVLERPFEEVPTEVAAL